MNHESLDIMLHNAVDARMKELEQKLHERIRNEIQQTLEPNSVNSLKEYGGEQVEKLHNKVNWLTGVLIVTYLLLIMGAIGGGILYLRSQQSNQPTNLQQQVE